MILSPYVKLPARVKNQNLPSSHFIHYDSFPHTLNAVRGKLPERAFIFSLTRRRQTVFHLNLQRMPCHAVLLLYR